MYNCHVNNVSLQCLDSMVDANYFGNNIISMPAPATIIPYSSLVAKTCVDMQCHQLCCRPLPVSTARSTYREEFPVEYQKVHHFDHQEQTPYEEGLGKRPE